MAADDRTPRAGEHAGTEKLAASRLGEEENALLEVTSTAFQVGHTLPRAATADGAELPPPISWRGAPREAQSIALICEDPDAPASEPFVHWLVYGVPAKDSGTLDAGSAASAREGANGRGNTGYTGAAPPRGHGVHHYHFQVFALDQDPALPPGADRAALLDAMRGHVLAWGDLVGTYERR